MLTHQESAISCSVTTANWTIPTIHRSTIKQKSMYEVLKIKEKPSMYTPNQGRKGKGKENVRKWAAQDLLRQNGENDR